MEGRIASSLPSRISSQVLPCKQDTEILLRFAKKKSTIDPRAVLLIIETSARCAACIVIPGQALSSPTPTGVVALTVVGADNLRAADINGELLSTTLHVHCTNSCSTVLRYRLLHSPLTRFWTFTRFVMLHSHALKSDTVHECRRWGHLSSCVLS